MLHGRMLRYLDEVARSGSMRRAATRLNVASSAINRQLLALEAEIGTPLFERMPRGLRLTATGELLISHVRGVLKEHDRVLARIEALRGHQRGEVTVATMGGLAGGILAEVIEAFQAAHPRIRLVVRSLPLDGIVNALLAGEADLALAFNLPRNARLRSLAGLDHRLGAAMSPDHPLSGRLTLRLVDCLDHPLVMAPAGMTIRDQLAQAMPGALDLTPAVETNSVELMKRLVAKPPMITFLGELDIDRELRSGELTLVPLRELARLPQRLSLAHRAQGPLDTTASLVAAAIQRALEARRAIIE